MRSIRAFPSIPASQRGFLLPLASGGSLLLLLSCLSLQTLIWGRQLEGRGVWQQRQVDDLLASAAQRLAVAFNRSHQCLLALPSSRWPASIAVSAGCEHPVDPAVLLQSQLPDGAVRLIGWWPPQPSTPSSTDAATGWGLMTLARSDGASASAPAQRRYRLLVAGEPPRVIRVQELDR